MTYFSSLCLVQMFGSARRDDFSLCLVMRLYPSSLREELERIYSTAGCSPDHHHDRGDGGGGSGSSAGVGVAVDVAVGYAWQIARALRCDVRGVPFGGRFD
jgi:hypothetical protein